jgi:hypothetical protein
MSTLKQQEANRLNAQKSTGPRTLAGKAVSRFSALKSGIDAEAETLPDEKSADLEALVAEYQARFDTSTPERRAMLDVLVNAEWMLRRLRRGEMHLWKATYIDTENPASRIVNFGSPVYERVQRRINACLRNYRTALRELETLPVADEEPEPLQQDTPAIGFVPQPPGYLMQPQAEQVGQALPPALSTPQQPQSGGAY